MKLILEKKWQVLGFGKKSRVGYQHYIGLNWNWDHWLPIYSKTYHDGAYWVSIQLGPLHFSTGPCF